ncbi:hypothetical protein GQ53DRAFT_741024 [Thozetella sp. PMI_491]|nr:hypothetical protein GQ53DRAFT_741024 [Thozetella sp. PMI_491]
MLCYSPDRTGSRAGCQNALGQRARDWEQQSKLLGRFVFLLFLFCARQRGTHDMGHTDLGADGENAESIGTSRRMQPRPARSSKPSLPPTLCACVADVPREVASLLRPGTEEPHSTDRPSVCLSPSQPYLIPPHVGSRFERSKKEKKKKANLPRSSAVSPERDIGMRRDRARNKKFGWTTSRHETVQAVSETGDEALAKAPPRS